MRRHIATVMIIGALVAGGLMGQTVTQNPHGSIKWDCQDCHTADSWTTMQKPMKFKHDETGFHLTGAHQSAPCASCHKDKVFSHVATACADCHSDHHLGQLGPNCQNCHTPQDWQGRKDLLEMHAQKGFALTGVHAVADCESCHRKSGDNEFAGTPLDCEGCHETEMAQAKNPDHILAGFRTNCALCHHAAYSTWTKATYTHPASFPITGMHRQVDCVTCHKTTYTGTSSACYDCHATEFASAKNPDHRQTGFSRQCTICHTTNGWTPATYDHNQTAFPLTGRHQTVACVACHATTYAGTPADCYSCHQTDFQNGNNPNHLLANFDHQCTTCHTTSGWTPSSFNHSTTGFALTGKHVTALCSDCHATTYAGTATDCYSCHQTNFQQATDPNHVQNNFSHDCGGCHSTSGWTPATFDHNTTSFPLTGKHATITCISCHASGFAGTPTDCYACHKSDYDGTNNPVHSAANFPTTCQTCHNTSDWTNTTWNHDAAYFPIYSGSHQGRWTTCADCHVNQANFATFECINCHAHTQAQTDPHHTDVRNYQYLSTACYSCHPRGTSGGD